MSIKLDDFKEKVDSDAYDKKIIVYGCGCYAQKLMDYIELHGKVEDRVFAIALSKKETSTSYRGITIYAISELVENVDRTVIVATSKLYHQEIIKNLKQLGFNNITLMDEEIRDYISDKVMMHHSIGSFNDRLSNTYDEIIEIKMRLVLDRALSNSKWCKRTDFNPGKSAVNSEYLYLLFKILDSNRITSVLDIGMGQSTKLISQYIEYNDKASGIVIEADEAWLSYYSREISIPKRNVVKKLEYEFKPFNGEEVRVYKDFENALLGESFDLISIDGPLGYDMNNWSRIDCIEVIPECLKKSFIIMLDDINRRGEQNTRNLIFRKLDEAGIEYCYSEKRGGGHSFIIITSSDNKIFNTI